MGAGTTGGWVVVGLGFGAGEEGGELGFGDVFAGGWRGHFFFFFFGGEEREAFNARERRGAACW